MKLSWVQVQLIFLQLKIPQWLSSYFLFFQTFYFVLDYSRLTNNIVIVSGEQWRDSAIHIHVSILPQTPLPSRLPHIEQSSLCDTVGPCWLSISNIAVCTCPPKIPLHSFNYFFNTYSRPSCGRWNLCLALHYFSKRGHRDYSFSFFGAIQPRIEKIFLSSEGEQLFCDSEV